LGRQLLGQPSSCKPSHVRMAKFNPK